MAEESATESSTGVDFIHTKLSDSEVIDELPEFDKRCEYTGYCTVDIS